MASTVRIPVIVAQTGPVAPSPTGRSMRTASTTQPGAAQAREHFNNRALNQMQTKVANAVQAIKALPFAQGNFFPGLTFISGVATPVLHLLGRPYQGAWLMNPTLNYLSYGIIANASTNLNASQITIKCQNTVIADVWVY